MKKILAGAAGLALAGTLFVAPGAFAQHAEHEDISTTCNQPGGFVGTYDGAGEPSSGIPDGSDNSGEVRVCVNGTQGNADGAGRVGGDADDASGYIVADGNSSNGEKTRGYIGVQVDGTNSGVTSDGCDEDYSSPADNPAGLDPEGTLIFLGVQDGEGCDTDGHTIPAE